MLQVQALLAPVLLAVGQQLVIGVGLLNMSNTADRLFYNHSVSTGVLLKQ